MMPAQDRIARIGPAVDAARGYYLDHSSAWHDIVDTTLLFGEPALKLRLPPLPVEPDTAPGWADGKVTLSWPHRPENTSYQVWGSEQPYFAPDDGDTLKLADVAVPPTGDPAFTDEDTALRTRPYFYAARGINPLGASTVTHWTGRFPFSLTPGAD